MRRICFMLPDLRSTRKFSNAIHHIGVDDAHIHVLGKNPAAVDRAHLHRATIFQTTDIIPAFKRGMLFGFILGLAISALFYLTLPEGEALPGYTIVICLLFGVAVGLWVSGMIGIGIPDKVVEAYEDEIKAGHYLVMLDIPATRENELKNTIQDQFPEAEFATVLAED